MPSPEKAPPLIWKARARADPARGDPPAKPVAAGSGTRASRSTAPPPTAPVTPARIRSPPGFSAMPMATGVVTVLGAIDTSVAGDAPRSRTAPERIRR